MATKNTPAPVHAPVPAAPPVPGYTRSVPAIPDEPDDWGVDAGAGLEETTARDLLIPRLAVMQGLSPQLLPGSPEHIPGAALGDIADVGSKILFPAAEHPVLFLPVRFNKVWIEWREKRGGLVAIHTTPDIMDETTRNEDTGDYVLPSGNIVVETYQFYGLNLSAGGIPSFIPMAITQTKSARDWITTANRQVIRVAGKEATAPLYYRVYHLRTVMRKNDQGSWFVWAVEPGARLSELGAWGWDWQALRAQCRQLLQDLRSGALREDYTDQHAPPPQDDDGMGGAVEEAM